MASDFLQKIAHRTHVNGVGEGAVSIRLTTSLHEKRPVAVTRQAFFSRFESVSPKEMPRFSRLQRVAQKKLGQISRFRRVAWKKLAGFLDLGVFLGRNASEFPIWACCSKETWQNSGFRRVAWKKRAGIPDLGVFLRRNSAEFSI